MRISVWKCTFWWVSIIISFVVLREILGVSSNKFCLKPYQVVTFNFNGIYKRRRLR